jgi:MFS family permease
MTEPKQSAAIGGSRGGDRRRWVSRNLLVLCGVSFLQDAASELLYPILPIFLTSVLGAPVVAVGAVEGIAEGIASIAKVGSGRIADKVARRPLIALGYGLAALSKLIIAVATAWPVVLGARSLDRLGKGVRGAPRDALLVQDAASADRGKAFGLHRAVDTAGAVVGPLIGLLLYELLGHRIRPLLVVAVVPAVASVLLVALVRERRVSPPMPTRRRPAEPVVRERLGMPRRFWTVAVPLGVFALVNFPDALLLLRARTLGFSVAAVIGAYVAYNASYALLSYPAGALSDRLSRPLIFALGLGCFAVSYLGLGLIYDSVWVWPLMVIYGVFPALTDGVGKAWISSTAPAGRQGNAQGLFQGLSGVGVLVAGVWAGLAWGGDGRLPLIVSGAAAAALAVLLCLARHRLTGTAR